jgi:hypothetical protein
LSVLVEGFSVLPCQISGNDHKGKRSPTGDI